MQKSHHIPEIVLLKKMENLLTTQIEDLNQKNISVDIATIKQKALNIYHRLLQERPSTSNQHQNHEFSASGGWLSKFLDTHNFHNLKTKGEIASADDKASQEYCPKIILKIIQEDGYTADQVLDNDFQLTKNVPIIFT